MFSGYYGFWEQWEQYHSVTFDGIAKKIYVNPDVSEITIKKLYSEWKEWVRLYDNAKYLQAMRVIGGDSIGGGLYAGDTYFLINGWQLILDHAVEFVGVLYSDDYDSPFAVANGVQLARSTASNLVLQYSATGVDETVIAQRVKTELTPDFGTVNSNISTVNSNVTSVSGAVSSLTNIVNNIDIPTATEIADEVRVQLTPELERIMLIENGMTAEQADMLLSVYRLMGLDPTKPLIVTQTSRTAGPEIQQQITSNNSQTTITRL